MLAMNRPPSVQIAYIPKRPFPGQRRALSFARPVKPSFILLTQSDYARPVVSTRITKCLDFRNARLHAPEAGVLQTYPFQAIMNNPQPKPPYTLIAAVLLLILGLVLPLLSPS